MSEHKRVKVLVVEDSLTVRKHLVEVLSHDASLQVVAEAEDGQQGMELCAALRPDVVTMDMMMPRMTGLEATERIMAYHPTPIVIVSASINRGEVLNTFQSLQAGALEVVEKPLGNETNQQWEAQFISIVKMAARIKTISHVRGRLGGPRAAGPLPPTPMVLERRPRVVVLGASTGGPAALVQVLGGLPADYGLPIMLVLHIGAAFALPFADWLADQVQIPVHSATHGMPLPRVGEPGVIMAPPDRHLVLRGKALYLDRGPERHACRPSVDVLFESAAQELGPTVAGVLLTGMGKDGAQGLLAIRQAGGFTVAQDEQSSVVFGMPREAIRLGAAERVLPLRGIGLALEQLERTARPDPATWLPQAPTPNG